VVLAFGDRAEYVAQPENEPAYAPPLGVADARACINLGTDPQSMSGQSRSRCLPFSMRSPVNTGASVMARSRLIPRPGPEFFLLFFFYPNSFFSVLDGILY